MKLLFMEQSNELWYLVIAHCLFTCHLENLYTQKLSLCCHNLRLNIYPITLCLHSLEALPEICFNYNIAQNIASDIR